MVDHTRRLYIVAYGGEERQQRGQILFVDPQPIYSMSIIRALNWSPDGTYLLAFLGPVGKIYEANKITLKLCKYFIDSHMRNL